jgi:hypothetical protein
MAFSKEIRSHARRLLIPALIALAFIAGTLTNHLPFAGAEPANDGYRNQIIEILEGGSPTGIYSVPNTSDPDIEQVDVLRWGDRVMWDSSTEQNDTAGNRWIEVAIAEGEKGWMIANVADVNVKLRISSATYTTTGIEVGATVTVTEQGDQANFRSEPTVIPGRENILRFVDAGETLQVVGGPYQAEYFIWWQYEDSSGQVGWIVDVEGWFQPN